MTSYTRLAARRAERFDDFTLAAEVSRHAAVAARHLSYAEAAADDGDQRAADRWRYAAARQEDFFLAEVDEARTRLASDATGQFRSYLNLFSAATLIEEVA